MAKSKAVALRLFEIYKKNGFLLSSELEPEYVKTDKFIFTRLYIGHMNQTYHLGIAMREIAFLESLSSLTDFKTIFIIGNSFGFSTLALALMNPQAKVVAIEIGLEPFTERWIEATNTIAQAEGLNVKVVKGSSPENNAEIIERELGGSIDFAFVDGLHTNDAVQKDFDSLRPFGHNRTIYGFHDVLAHKMVEGLSAAVGRNPIPTQIFFATPSGIALASAEFPEGFDVFCDLYGSNSLTQAILQKGVAAVVPAA
ncbi:MAG: class I SAM-dependent methyltransferase [Niveispirillum sp.]|uniref:class I SAM-dependent methyltransferase n=1 Tax=Niveispirillum sp. TaxID=1917217 RepID=UPI003BA7C1F5